MTALPIKKQPIDNVIELRVINGTIEKKPKVRYNKDGSVDKRHSNSLSGVSKEVYPLTKESEIKAIVDLLEKRIEEATDENKKQIAHRNKMMFLIGINLGIRASDLCGLKYSFFMNKDGTFKEGYSLQPKKTQKHKKFVKLYFNQVVKKAITEYIQNYPYDDIDEYLFKSRKGDKSISEHALWDIMNNTAIEAGIKQNIGSHTLRKTFGYWVWHSAEDKGRALVTLQAIFNHSSQNVTAKYIGLTNDEMCDIFNGLNLGIDFI